MNPNSYQIAKGDTLSAIAAKNKTTIQDLLKLNPNITDPNKIYAGQSLTLGGAVTPPITTVPPPVAPLQPGTGTATTSTLGLTPPPAPINYGDAAKNAGAAGLSVADTATLFGATPEEQKAQKDMLAKQFGYADSDSFYADVFRKPTQTTEQYYRDAYNAAGLADIMKQIEGKKGKLNQALGVVNDNPWYDEAFRRGEASRLQDLATGDIKNYTDAYDLAHDRVKELVLAHATDLGYDSKTNEARFNYLEAAAKEAAQSIAMDRTRSTLSSYVEGKNGVAKKPDTITIGDSAYAWNPSTQKFDLVVSNPKDPTSDLTPYQKFQATQDLQKNLQRYTQGAREIQRQFSVMESAYNRLQSGEALDLNATSQAIISTFNKIIDPTSVVRETEYARSPEGQSLIDALSGRIAALSQGGPGLTPASLKEFVDISRVFVENAQRSIQESGDLAAQNAKAFGLDASLLGLPGTPSSGGGTVSLNSWANF
jgi:LysM repeat protein